MAQRKVATSVCERQYSGTRAKRKGSAKSRDLGIWKVVVASLPLHLLQLLRRSGADGYDGGDDIIVVRMSMMLLGTVIPISEDKDENEDDD